MNAETKKLLDECQLLSEQQLAIWDQLKSDSERVSRICTVTAVAIFFASLLALGINQLLTIGIAVTGFVACASIDAITTYALTRRCTKKAQEIRAQRKELVAKIEANRKADKETLPGWAVHLRLHPAKPRRKNTRKFQRLRPY